jgi:hypothetical protein
MNYTKLLYNNTILLGLIVLLAGGLRLYGLNWDDSQHLHPDERFIVLTAVTITWPDSFSDYLNPETSPLSPYNTASSTSYIYGTFPLFLTKGLAAILNYDTYGTLHMVGRLLSALFDLGSVLLVYLIAARLFSQKAGMLSAAFYAVAVLHIQQSHFFTVDNFLVFWILATFLLLLIFLAREAHRALILSSFIGASYACALGSKASAVLFVTIVFTAFGIKYVQSLQKASWQKNALILLGNATVFTLSTYCLFRIVQPYAFASGNWLDLTPQPDFWTALEFQRRAVAGEVMFPPQWQWVNTTPILFPLNNLLLWGLGLPLGIASLLGVGLFLRKQIKSIAHKNERDLVKAVCIPGLIAVIWIFVSFTYGGLSFVKSMRYLLPVTPFLIMFAAYTCDTFPPRVRILTTVSTVLIFVPSFLWALAYVSIYSHETTRVTASNWIYTTLPESSVLANEEWDDALPLGLFDPAVVQTQAKHKHFESFLMQVYNPDNADKTAELCEDLRRADYIILSSPRARATIGRLPDYFPIMTRYYHLLETGGLGFEMVKECTSFPHLPGWGINDSSAEESFWVYDHPPVRIYKKIKVLSRDDCKEVLMN